MKAYFAVLIVALNVSAYAGAPAGKEPQPRVVDPGGQAKPPSDALVLFDGTDTAHWVYRSGKPAAWPVQNGAIVCKSGTGDIYSKEKFRNAQIHVEFAIPNMPEQHDQARGNSGVYVHGLYEIQVLDSYQNPTYPTGSCGALYGQYAPLVNASRPPEQWQTYDIIFHAPKCTGGQVTTPGRLTIIHNGVLIQDHVAIKGPTSGSDQSNQCEAGPLRLQDHYHPAVKETFMRFRNIWLRQLTDE